jgi:putative transposase
MARQIRIEYDGAAYHVMARGNQGQAIFANDLDRKVWLETLAEACEKTGWRIQAYVMMGNHYHLLVETPQANLVAGMKWLSRLQTGKQRPKRFTRLHQTGVCIRSHNGGTTTAQQRH